MNTGYLKLGCCGWSFFQPKQFYGPKWKNNLESVLQAYATLFDIVEVNSTFYKLPKVSTAERWRDQALQVNKNFEFVVKAFKGITHLQKFSDDSFELFEKVKTIARALEAKTILFQTPASFKPTEQNINKLKHFFKNIDRERFKIALELRWANTWNKDVVTKLFRDLKIEQCIDCLRQNFSYNKKFYYYRLHGLGSPMYNYRFSGEELKKIRNIVLEKLENKKICYIFFNNYRMYEDALRFKELIQKSYEP